MAVQKQDDQHEHTFSNYVRIRDVVQKTCLRRWTIEKSGERGSGISVLPARHDDDWYLTSLVSSYPILISWHFLVCEGCRGIAEEKKIGGKRKYLSNFNFISFGIFARLRYSEKCLLGLFENRRFSQIRRWNVLVVSGGKCHNSGWSCPVVFVSVCRFTNSRYNPHAKPKNLCHRGVLHLAAGWLKVISVWSVQL